MLTASTLRFIEPAAAQPAAAGRRVLPTFDPRTVWAALPRETQDFVGAATVALFASQVGGGATPELRNAFSTAEDSATEVIMTALGKTLCDIPAGQPPNMNALGIRTCVGCGCTDAITCENHCDWAQDYPPRCTNCV